jgi:hypothetical protein
MVGERPRPFAEPLGFDPITSTLIFGEHDAVLADAMTTVAEALADWIALHNRNLETIYITHAHFDHFYGLSVLLDGFPGARAITTPKAVEGIQMYLSPPVQRLARRMFPGQVPTKLVGPEPYEQDTVPALVEKINQVMSGSNAEIKNAIFLLQMGLEHNNPLIAGLLFTMGLDAILGGHGRHQFKKRLCECLRPKTLASLIRINRCYPLH